MRPSPLLSQPESIGNHADNTEMFKLLHSMMREAPCPENVLKDVDPCKFAPWDLPESMLYFMESLEGEKEMLTTEKGYWLAAGSHPSTLTRSGMITALEFYRGHGDKTDWVMYKYTIDDKALGSSSLCEVFSRSDPSHTKENQLAVADDTDAELEQAILLSLEEKEKYSNFHNSINTEADLDQAILQSLKEVERRNDRGPSNMSGINPLNLRPDSSAQHVNEAYDFSRGDYLEANDLIDAVSSSSSNSENTCFTSRNSEEYFNPDYLLHELETQGRPDNNPETDPRNADCRRSVAASQGSRQVLIQPPASGSIGRCSNEMPTMISMQRKQGFDPTHSDRMPSKRGTAAHEVSLCPSSSQDAKVHGKGEAVGRIAKLKKYFCFIPF